jgi:AcrR family transcriptional regulator
MNVTNRRAPGSPQREAILVAATAIFLRYGFKKTSMDDVARAAGVSRQGLYLYFDTKDLLFSESLQHLMSRLISNARAAAEQAGVTVAELSEQLLMTAKGIKTSVDTLTAYRERMLIAIRIMMRSP